jgi:hypothetical protein
MGSTLGAMARYSTAFRGRDWVSGVSMAALFAMSCGLVVSLGSPALGQTLIEAEAEFGQGLSPFPAEGPLIAVVSISSQKMRVFDRNGLVTSTRVSTGRNGYETPEGVFSILERKVDHNSNLYDDAPMPFMQRLTWSGVALHEGVVPNHRASHGCIRLPNGFAEQLFRTTRLATRVVIVGHDAMPEPISHPALFQPAQIRPAQTSAASGDRPGSMPDSTAGPTYGSGTSLVRQVVGHVPVVGSAPSPEATASKPVELDLAELKARRILADKRLAEATGAFNSARRTVRPKRIEQGLAQRSLRMATAQVRRAEERARETETEWLESGDPQVAAAALAARIEALVDLAAAERNEALAREDAALKAAAARGAIDHVKKLAAVRQKALNDSRSLARRLSPVTVFVSRETGRVYVRRALHQLMDVAVTVRDPDRPLGTHIFKAMDAVDPSAPLEWRGLTIETPDGSSPLRSATPGRRGKSGTAGAERTPGPDPLQSARAALDRIEFPEEVLSRILPTMQAGATLIVSDLGPSIETGPGTDIVVQTKGEEQAKQNIARFVARQRAAARGFASWSEQQYSRRRSQTTWDRSGGWNRW